jgi:hypothetical protein
MKEKKFNNFFLYDQKVFNKKISVHEWLNEVDHCMLLPGLTLVVVCWD